MWTLALAGSTAAHCATENSEWSVTAGAKLWENKWESWIIVPTVFNQASRQVVETDNSSSELAVIRQVSARYGRLASVSALTPMKVQLPFPDGAGDSSRRAVCGLGEARVVYSLSELTRYLPSLNIALGYRAQTLTTRSYALLDSNTPQVISHRDARQHSGPSVKCSSGILI
jgi:hypothetical protein